MILECPYCATRFRLDVRALGDRRPSLRCSQCSRTFDLPPIADPEEDLTYEDDFDEYYGEHDDYRFDKPPLTYWWMRAHFAVFGSYR